MSVASALARGRRGLFAFLAVAAFGAANSGGLAAQGVTTGAVRGRVIDQASQPIAGVQITLVNNATGQRFTTSTEPNGYYFIPNVVVGLYQVQIRAIGFRPRNEEGRVRLGGVTEGNFQLEAAAVELEPITVTGATQGDLRSRTGAVSTVSRDLIGSLPSINRNFTDFAATNSLVNSTSGGTGVSIAGTSDRFNNLQIDGGTNTDLFGLSASRGTPGGRNNSRPLSIEAVQEYQVLIAPFDIRQGGFTGGLVNAVTRSGTNEFHGSLFYSLQNENLVGDDTLGNSASDFSLSYYGFSVGGPIIRDRLHFFVSTEWRSQTAPFGGLVIGTDTTNGADSVGIGIRRATAERVRQYAAANLGFDPGSPDRADIPNPDQNLFVKLSAQVGAGGQAELSFNRVRSSVFVLNHDISSASPTRIRDGYQFDASGYHVNSATNSLRARLNTPIGSRLTNEAIVSYNFFEDNRAPDQRRPQIIVGGDRGTTFMALGGERFSHDNLLQQKTLEIADNLTYSRGAHVFTLGGRIERFQFLNRFFAGSLGNWFFPDTTAFFNGAATRYEIGLPGVYVDSVNGRTDGPIAEFTFSQFALYAQDQIQPTRRLSLTFGARIDFTNLPSPKYNPRVDTATVTVGPRAGSPLGVRTDNALTTATLFSPRFGFNYDVDGSARTIVRGGVGLFAGRTPYVWASNAYTNTGLEQVQLTCTGAAVPNFTADPASQPTACLSGGLSAAVPQIVYFDENFKLPQTMRASLGVDRRLPYSFLFTFDALYTRSVNQFILNDENLVQGGYSFGEANRPLYGTLSSTSSSSTPRRMTATGARDVLRQYNSNQDYSYSLTFQLSRRVGGSEFLAGYTYSRSYDLMSYSSDISNSLMNFSTLDGLLRDRNLRPSWFDIPHSVRLSGTTTLPYGVQVSLFYSGRSGRPYGWTYGSDVNGDGFSGNDMVYVPVSSSDISLANPTQWARLDSFITSQECLRDARGTILRRNSCRNPWVSFVDARVVKSFNTIRGQRVELTANVFNLLSLLGLGGRVYSVTGFENITMLTRSGYRSAMGRGVYNLALPANVKFLDSNASRWKLEFGARYTF